MKKMLVLALVVVFVMAHPWESVATDSDRGHPWEEVSFWPQFEAEEIQLAIVVSEDEIATEDIPVDWTREMIVDWLEAGWLVIEGVIAEEPIPDQKKQCHFIVRDYHRLCVTGAGAKRCDCYNDVHY